MINSFFILPESGVSESRCWLSISGAEIRSTASWHLSRFQLWRNWDHWLWKWVSFWRIIVTSTVGIFHIPSNSFELFLSFLERIMPQCSSIYWYCVAECSAVMLQLLVSIRLGLFCNVHHCVSSVWQISEDSKCFAVSSRNSTAEVESLERILRRSQCHKGRLLHYFPNSDRSHQSVRSSSWIACSILLLVLGVLVSSY